MEHRRLFPGPTKICHWRQEDWHDVASPKLLSKKQVYETPNEFRASFDQALARKATIG